MKKLSIILLTLVTIFNTSGVVYALEGVAESAPVQSDWATVESTDSQNAEAPAQPNSDAAPAPSEPGIAPDPSGSVPDQATPTPDSQTSQEQKAADDPSPLDDETGPTYNPEKSSLNNFKKEAGLAGSLRVDNFSGAAVYNLNLEIPKGRNGLNPSLNLYYNSHDKSVGSWTGMGWGLELGYLVRSTRKGTNNLYTGNEYTLFLNGQSHDLVLIDQANNIYGSKMETDFLKVQYLTASASWEVTDNLGNKYYFGQAAAARQDNPQNSEMIYKWMLDKVLDTNDNHYTINYTKDQSQIYPQTIIYTNHGAETGPMAVQFILEDRLADVSTGYQAQFPVTTAKRLKEIKALVNGQDKIKYEFIYTTGQDGYNTLLSSVTKKGYLNGQWQALPATNFTYQQKPAQWYDDTANWLNLPHLNTNPQNPGGAKPLWEFNGDSWVDFGNQIHNGTGWVNSNWNFSGNLSDKQQSDINGDKYTDWDAEVNNRQDGFISGIFTLPSFSWTGFTFYPNSSPFTTNARMTDINNDGLADIIESWDHYYTRYNNIYLNNGAGWTGGGFSNPPVPFAYCTTSGNPSYTECTSRGTQLIDINGDGLVDIFQPSNDVYLNTGTSWETQPNPTWSVPALPGSFNDIWLHGGARFTDINSDGLLDIVASADNNINSYHLRQTYLNTGHGWQLVNGWALPEGLPFFEYNPNNIWEDMGLRLMDLDNDGLMDLVKSYCSTFYGDNCNQPIQRDVRLAVGEEPNLLATISNGYGGQTTIEYQASGRYFYPDGTFKNPKLPINMQTVKQITTTDGQANQTVIAYDYQDGLYYYDSDYSFTNDDYTLQQFAGFGLVTEITGDRVVKSYYYQGAGVDNYELGEYEDSIYKKGKVFREEIYQQDGANQYILSHKVNTWKQDDLGNGRIFVYLDSSVTYDYQEGQQLDFQGPSAPLGTSAQSQYLAGLSQAQNFRPTQEPQLVSQSDDGRSKIYYLGIDQEGKYHYKMEAFSLDSVTINGEILPGDGEGTKIAENCELPNGPTWQSLTVSPMLDYINSGGNNDVSLTNYYSGSLCELSRLFLPFDTSAMPDDAVTTSSVLKLTAHLPVESAMVVHVVNINNSGNPNLNSGWWGLIGNISGAQQTISNVGPYQFTFNQQGLSWIDPVGFTILGVRGDYDLEGAPPTSFYYGFYTSEAEGTVNDPLLTIEYILNHPPAIPTNLQTEGQTNPSEITDQNPEFSAIYNDDNLNDQATHYRIQVIATGGSFETPLWDSQKQQLTSQIVVGQRSEEISYGGSPLPLTGLQYFWRLKFWDNSGEFNNEGLWSTGQDYFYLDGSLAPTPPIDLEAEGKTNPVDLLNLTPGFTAVYTDGNPVDYAKWYQIQVDNNQDFTSPEWDSPKTLLNTLIANGQRSEEIVYAGTPLTYNGYTYYWRIRFWDYEGEEGTLGDWSTEPATFNMFDENNVLTNAKASAVKYVYETAHGNLTQEINYGEVNAANNGVYIDDTSDNLKITNYQYAVNENKHIFSAPSRKILTDQITDEATQTDLYYDNLPLGQIDKVNLTKEDLEQTSPYESDYNEYGLVTAKRDPFNNETTITYDTYNYYPSQTTNALNQTVTTTYDLATGQILSTIDPNGLVEERSYDVFGRLLEVKRTDPANPPALISMETYEYHDTDSPFWFKKSVRVDQTNWLDSYNYFDGLGRVIQTKQETVTPDTQEVDIRASYDFEPEHINNNTVIDTSSYGNNATIIVQPPAYIDWVAGPNGGQAIYFGGNFNGNPAYLLIPNNTSLNDFNNTISVAGWAKTQVQGHNMALIAKTGWINFMVSVNYYNKLRFEMKFAGGNHDITSSIEIPNNQWFYFQAVYDGIKMKLYLDNELVGQMVVNDQMNIGTNDFNVAWNSLCQGDYFIFNGAMDDVLIAKGDIVEGSRSDYITTSYQYDEQGNLYRQSLPMVKLVSDYEAPDWNNLVKNEYTYDTAGRVLTEVSPVGTTLYNYDAWKTTVTDANNKAKNYYRDANNQLATVDEILDSVAYPTTYQYNYLGNLIKITDSQNNTRDFAYDSLGRLTSQQEMHKASAQSWGTWNYQYDAASNLTSKTDAKNQTVGYTYDDLNRILTEDYAGTTGTDVSYVYDQGANSIGRLTSVSKNTNPTVSTSYTYDLWGRTLTETKDIKGRVFTTGYTYNLSSQPLTITYPDNFIARYTYNSIGQTSQVYTQESGQAEQTIVNSVLYSPLGQIQEIDYQNGTVSQMDYDINQAYRMVGKETVKGTSTLQNISYTYDNVGNITDIADTAPNQLAKTASYVYDDLYRLTSATIVNNYTSSTTVQSFSYDIIGNMLTKSDIGAYQYLNNNPYQTSNVAGRAYTYDNNGNLTNDRQRTMVYDYMDRMTSVAMGGTTTNYYYDQSKNRVAKQNPTTGAYTEYPNKYYEKSNNKEERYVFLGNQRLGIVEKEGTSTVTYLNFTDHLNSSSVTTDNNGYVTNLIDYMPYGTDRINVQNQSFNPSYKFTDQEKDNESGLMYYDARYYNQNIGKFIQPDPALLNNILEIINNPQGLNAYAYSLNNPIKYIDPNGETPIEVGWGITVGFVQRAPELIGGVIKGVYNFVTHPLQSIKSITNTVVGLYNSFASAFESPSLAYQAIAQYANMSFDEFMSMNDYGRGKVIGGFVADGVAMYYGGKAIGKAADVIKGGNSALSVSKFMNYLGKIRAEKGMFGIGSASREEALQLGKAWSGAAKEIIEDGKVVGYSSKDGLKAFRLQYKDKLGKWQANYQENMLDEVNGGKIEIRNAHLDIN